MATGLTHRASMKLHTFSRVVPFAAVLMLFACEAPPANPAGTAADNKAAQDEGAATPEGDAESCPALSKKVCEQAGDQSMTCINSQKSFELLSPRACATALADIDFTLQKIIASAKLCNDLIDRLCKDIGTDTQTCKMLQGQVGTMAPEQCESMTTEYPKVLEEVQRMEAQNKP